MSDAPDRQVFIDDHTVTGRHECGYCSIPTDDEPCREHQPDAHRRMNQFTKPTMAEVLELHRIGHTIGYAVHCVCDSKIGIGMSPDVFYRHQAAMLAAAGYGDVAAAKAEALREAADELEGQFPYNCQLRPDGSEDPQMDLAVQVTHESAIVLRERANHIAADDAETGKVLILSEESIANAARTTRHSITDVLEIVDALKAGANQ